MTSVMKKRETGKVSDLEGRKGRSDATRIVAARCRGCNQRGGEKLG
jgi:hypothetical protein